MSDKAKQNPVAEYSLHILFEDYIKISKVNFFTGEYRIIKALPSPAAERAMREKRFDSYIRRLGESGQVHRDDAKTFVRYMNSKYVKDKLLAGKRVVIHGIRYKIADVYVWTTIEMYVPHGLSEDNSWALFTMRESETAPIKLESEFPDGCCKLLKVNLTEDSYEIICVRENELAIADIAPRMSEWFAVFAQTGVMAEDREGFRDFVDIEKLRSYFAEAGSTISFSYRRKFSGGYRPAEMGLVLSAEYTDKQQIVFLYVKDDTCDESRLQKSIGYYSERDVSVNMWNKLHYERVCGVYSESVPRPVGAVFAELPRNAASQSGRILSFSWLLSEEFDRENCFHLGGGSFVVLLVGESEDVISRRADKLRKRLEEMGDRTEVSWAWNNAPASIEDIVTAAERKRRVSLTL